MNLSIDFNSAILWNHFIGYRDSFKNGNSLVYDGVIFHTERLLACCQLKGVKSLLYILGHAEHPIDFLNAQPM